MTIGRIGKALSLLLLELGERPPSLKLLARLEDDVPALGDEVRAGLEAVEPGSSQATVRLTLR